MRYKRLIAVVLCFVLLLSGCFNFSGKRGLTYTDTLFDTVISVQILDPADEEVIKGVEKLCKEYDTKFSKNNKDGEIYKINHAKGKAVKVSDDTITLIKKALYYSNLSNGIFDITIGAVSNLWDFKEAKKVPSSKKINAARRTVNYKNIILSDDTVMLSNKKTQLDVGAIAKGYIADRIKDYLLDEGIKHAVINLGGNVLTIGTKPDGSEYNIGIQKPFNETGEPITSVKLTDKSIVTTGIYQRYFKKGSKIYHHVLDPKTGRPCKTNLYSVSIITDSSLTADALSTICCLMGYKDALDLINRLDNVDAVFITKNNDIRYSANFLIKQRK